MMLGQRMLKDEYLLLKRFTWAYTSDGLTDRPANQCNSSISIGIMIHDSNDIRKSMLRLLVQICTILKTIRICVLIYTNTITAE